MSWSKSKRRAYNRRWMRRKRTGSTQPKYVKRRIVGWNNLFKAVRRP